MGVAAFGRVTIFGHRLDEGSFGVVVCQRISCSLVLCLTGGAMGYAQSATTVPTVETILARMAQAQAENRAKLRPYQVTRDYRLFGKEKVTTKSEVVAAVTFVPPDVKEYAIHHAKGTGIGEKVVRLMLDQETKVVKNYGSTDVSPANYDFRFLREEEFGGRSCYVMELLPKRKDKNLLKGKVWVDAATFRVRRTEGEPAKTLSWWLRDVRIALVYGEVGDMWLQTGSESTANVRLLGQHTMVSRDLDYKISKISARR